MRGLIIAGVLLLGVVVLSVIAEERAQDQRAKERDDVNRRHDEAERDEAARARAREDAADASRLAALDQADAEAQTMIAELRALSPGVRIKRAKEACLSSAWCPNVVIDRILAACDSDAERAAVISAIQPIIKKKSGTGNAQGSPAEEPSDPRSRLCPYAAKRAIERMESCGLNMDGIDEATLCARMTYDKLSFMGSRSCAEISTIMFGQ